jgi:hypothetical protein
MWNGHLAVLVEERWLLDPTVDQVNGENICIVPLAIELETTEPTRINCYGCEVQYYIRERQVGFAHAPDARPSHWREVAEAMKQVLERNFPWVLQRQPRSGAEPASGIPAFAEVSNGGRRLGVAPALPLGFPAEI